MKYSAKILFVPPSTRHRTKAWHAAYQSLRSLNPALPIINAETAAVILDKTEGEIAIHMQGSRSSSEQIAAIHATLVQRYVLR